MAAGVSKPRHFPSPARAERPGLLLVGGQLSPDWLLDAYGHGIFPWPLYDGTLAWWSPDPRAVIEFDRFHVSRRLERTCRAGAFEITRDRAFDAVIEACGSVGDRCRGTWLTPPMLTAYKRLHRLGHAHSIEAWQDGELAGGVYGLALGGMYSAESMFYRRRDASKAALVALVRHLRERGYTLLDIQQLTPHTARLGASEIPRHEFLARVAEAVARNVAF